MPRKAYYSHKITAIKDEALIWNHNKIEDEMDDTLHFPPPRLVILKLKKGESIEGFAWHTKEEFTTWIIQSDALKGGGIASAYDVAVEEIPKASGEQRRADTR
jgi:hypothetical protein